MKGREARTRPRLTILAIVVATVVFGLTGMLIASAAGVMPSQVPSWKIFAPTPLPSLTPNHAPGAAPPLRPDQDPPGLVCANPGYTPQAGIYDFGQAPFSAGSFPVRNSWSGLVGSDRLEVYAGGQSSNHDGTPDLAAVRVVEANETANHCHYEWRPLGDYTLVGHRWLKITAVNGTVMTLTTDDGATVTFDLVARRFQ